MKKIVSDPTVVCSSFNSIVNIIEPVISKHIYIVQIGKGTFISESAAKMSNRHIKVPKIAPALLFPISSMIFIEKTLIFSFFYIHQMPRLNPIYTCNCFVLDNFLYFESV